MTTQSPDLLLELVDVVVVFLSDGLIALYGEHNSHGKRYESGDLLDMCREGSHVPETTVVLGFGETEQEAVEEARVYFRRLCKWDGYDNASEVLLFGHELSQLKEKSQVDIF